MDFIEEILGLIFILKNFIDCILPIFAVDRSVSLSRTVLPVLKSMVLR